MTPTLPPKKEVALALIERSDLFVHLDPRIDGVVVPPWFRKQPELVLRVGLNMSVPIPDLRFDDDGITCTLSFNRQPFYCVLPWVCVFGLRGEDGMGLIWPEDVPREVREGGGGPKPKPAAKLSVVKNEAKESKDSKTSKAAKEAKDLKESVKESNEAKTSAGSESGTGTVAAPDTSANGSLMGDDDDDESAAPVSTPPPPPSPREAREKRRPSVSSAAARVTPPPATPPGDDDPPPDSPRPSSKGKGKPKRELPPYLRVIK